MRLIFWLTVILLFYVYVGYPLLLAVLARSRREPLGPEREYLPSVTLLISAYNEKAVIEEKIRNVLALDYPRASLSAMIISDASNDGTDEIVLQYAAQGIELIRLAGRSGKSVGLNVGVAHARGDFLVFSDANAMYQPDAIRVLLRHFLNPEVGYVVGKARYVKTISRVPSAESEGLYWKVESWLKQRESSFGSVVGGDGAIYAIRRQLYTPLRATDINDFTNPLQIIVRGYRGVYESGAICFERAGDTFAKEFGRKVRIVSRSLNAVLRVPKVLLPWTQPRHWLALLSHKILRWFAPLFLLAALITNVCLWRNSFYLIIAILQLGFYFLAGIGWTLKSRKSISRWFSLPYYFCLVNLASLLGIIKCMIGSLNPTWQTVRQHEPVL